MEACRQVGENARPVSELADELGVCWWTIMCAVDEHGRPLVEDPDRVGDVRSLGVDETSFLRATRDHPTIYATGLVDLDERILIDLVEGNSAADLRRWLDAQPRDWLEGIGVVATDLAESYRAGLAGRLDHATRVADPFHVVRSGTGASIRCGAGSRTRPSATAAASVTRSTGSASSCSPALNGSTRPATSACSSGSGSGQAALVQCKMLGPLDIRKKYAIRMYP